MNLFNTFKFRACWLNWHPDNIFIADYFLQAMGAKEKALKTISNATLTTVRNYFDTLDIKNNTKRRYFAQIKAFFGIYEKETKLAPGWRRILDVHAEKCTYIYLNVDDIRRLSEAPTEDDQEEAARDTFILGCLTGARISDYSQFKPENITDGVLSYVSKKTGQYARIPVCGIVERMVENHSKAFTVKFTERYLNIAIKRLAERCGLTDKETIYQGHERITEPKYKLITSHTARRSFCRNLREYNTPVETIRDFAGHTNVAMTERYIGRGLNFKEGKKTADFFAAFN